MGDIAGGGVLWQGDDAHGGIAQWEMAHRVDGTRVVFYSSNAGTFY